jgi:hypoxanthine phosphoribosyltransferase
MTEHKNAAGPGEVLLTAEKISEIVARLGRDISRDYEGKHPILVNLLKGGVVFLADLIRQLTIPHRIEFMHVSSYENGVDSSGTVRISVDLSCSIKDRDVLIVEDVIDTGTTLAYILDILRLRGPRSIEVCSLLVKKGGNERRGIPVRYAGIIIPDVFVVGYGLDYNESFRHLPYVAKLALDGHREANHL